METTMEPVKSINSTKVDQQTIDTLKELLAKAETGDLRSILFVDKYQNGEVGSGWAGRPDKDMIGEIEDLKFNIFSQAYFPVEAG
jgi:hypothetical protein